MRQAPDALRIHHQFFLGFTCDVIAAMLVYVTIQNNRLWRRHFAKLMTLNEQMRTERRVIPFHVHAIKNK
jgi:hypothetical protein